MLTKDQIETNWDRFKNLLFTVDRPGILELVKYLENDTDMKTAPASTRYHGNYDGGLCEHCLNVYDNLVAITRALNEDFDASTLIIVALLHDLAKINFYEKYEKNVKVGNEWVKQSAFKVIDKKNRFIYASHEQTSLFIASMYIDLSIEEQVSILSHHGGVGDKSLHIDTVSEMFSEYRLPKYLHTADLIDAYKQQVNE